MLFTKLHQENIEWEKNKIFCIYGSFSVSRYIKGGRNLDQIEFLDTLMFRNNPNWQSSGIITFLCKYDIVIPETLVGFFLNVLFLLLQDYHSFMRNEEGIKIELQKKVHRRICVRHVTFFDFKRSFLCHFLLPYSFTTFPKWCTYWIVPIKIHIAMGGSALCRKN